jgi:hypothetical protein
MEFTVVGFGMLAVVLWWASQLEQLEAVAAATAAAGKK